ncbi:MAG: cobalamin-dependent protein, partial [Acidobacteriota bacterium]
MNVLLLSMPDSFEHTPSITMRMPNGALVSLAGNIDPHHHVQVADLVLAQADVPGTVRRLLAEYRPDVVGLSIMTFQRKTAHKVIALVRSVIPEVTVVVGGYDPSLAPDAYEGAASGVDVIVRGEGDHTFRELLRALEAGAALDAVTGLSFRRGEEWIRNPLRHVSHLGDDIKLPNRAARVLEGYTLLGRPIDIVETSRGCTYDCSFCSI